MYLWLFMLRFGLSVILAFSISAFSLFAGPGEGNLVVDKENAGKTVVMSKLPLLDFPDEYPSQITTQGDESDGSQQVTTPKRKISEIYAEESDDEPSQRAKMVAVSPTAIKTPIGAMKYRFRGVRENVAKSQSVKRRLGFNLDTSENTINDINIIDTPEHLADVYKQTFPSNHFTHTGTFEGVPYYLDLRLFDPQQVVMRVTELSADVETNLERMQRGCAPFSYKVNPSVEQYLEKPIVVGDPTLPWGVDYVALLHKQQLKHRMDIHHLVKTMNDGVTPLPSDFHHGTDFGVVVKDGEVLAYGVSRKEARHFLKEGAKYYGDCLHPDFGDSKIDRKAFGKWRKGFWKYVANLIIEEKENGTYNPFSKLVPEIPIFSVLSSQESKF